MDTTDESLIAAPGCDLLVVGCGNLLRGDDGVGPVLVRHLWERGVPDSVRLVDGGTAGMDVAFQMRGAGRVVIVDASRTGAAPGTLYRVPGEQLEDLPPLEGLHTHAFRWDHALAFGRWLLGDAFPADVTVYLIEVAQVDPGAELTPVVRATMHQVIDLICAGWDPGAAPVPQQAPEPMPRVLSAPEPAGVPAPVNEGPVCAGTRGARRSTDHG